MRTSSSRLPVRALAVVTAALTGVTPAWAQVCPQTSSPTSWNGSTLDTGTPLKSGVVFDGTGARLHLEKAAGLFRSTPLGTTDLTVFAAAADFNQDGWDDFVGAGEATSFVRVYRNRTMDNLPPTPNWDDSSFVVAPKFTMARELVAPIGLHRWRPLAAGDFDGDGWPDVFVAVARTNSEPESATIYLNQGSVDGAGNPQFYPGYDALASGTSLAQLGVQRWGGTNVAVLDYNGDRKLDLVIGSGSNGGTIRVFLNNCTLVSPQPTPLPAPGQPLRCVSSTTGPRFAASTTLITNLGFPTLGSPATGNLAVFAYADVDGDGKRDLIAGAPSCCSTATSRLRLWKGIDGGGLSATVQSITFPGGATSILVADYSGDGRPDLIAGTDNFNYNAGNGGSAYYWVNSGTGTPFSGTRTQLTSPGSPTADFDVGFVFDYDNDPSHTPDVMIADGNHSSSFWVLANRVVAQYVPCGEVASGTIDLGSLANNEMVVTAARIDPTYTLNGGTVTFFMSNEDPANWVEASPCSDGSGDLCASFPKPVGREVRWKATMCASASLASTPDLRSVEMSFDYTEAREHFRAGVVVNDGVAYAGGFRQPGDRGHLFAVNAGLSTTYWDAADTIDSVADASRNIYTTDPTGTARLDFTTAEAGNPTLQSTLQVTDPVQASTLIDWVRSARFGIGNAGLSRSRLGAIETSTPAILTKPSFPIWYVYASAIERARHVAFQNANATRRPLVLFGAKDGMIHAVHTNPAAIAASPSGTEAWAFIPPKVAAGMLGDYTDSLSGTLTIKSYPDGSPTLADYRKPDGSYATAAIVSAGNGGQSIVAIDVTTTVNPLNGAINGPRPMWTATPGQGDAGQGHSKAAVARVLIGLTERYYVIAATGIAPDNPAAPWVKGRVVAAYDLNTGELVWQFRARCAITSDVTVFETDDEFEPGAPTINGYMDRVAFADACGNVYKVDPARDLDGAWNDNRVLGTIEVEDIDGVKQMALFSSAVTTDALGAESPITGTLAARSDNSARVVLFFGTGGLESHTTTTPNEFYAIYANTGAIRSKLTGTCTDGKCEKFYGGVVVTSEQVIFSRTTDPAVGPTSCDVGGTTLQAMELDAATNGTFVEDFSQVLAAAVMGAVYGDAGAIYFATLSGTISRIGTPRAAVAGGDSAAPPGSIPRFGQGSENIGGAATIGTTEALTLLGWRQVY